MAVINLGKVVGEKGSDGPKGLDGKGFNARGEWTSGEQYINDESGTDFVTADGQLYACRTTHTASSNFADDADYWQLTVKKGIDGIDGATIMVGSERAARVTFTLTGAVLTITAEV